VKDVTSALNWSERLGSVSFVPPLLGLLPEEPDPEEPEPEEPEPEELEPLLPDEPEPPDPEEPVREGGDRLELLEVPRLGPVIEEEPDACRPAPGLAPFDTLVAAGEEDVPDEQAVPVSANSATIPARHSRWGKPIIEMGSPRARVLQALRSSWARKDRGGGASSLDEAPPPLWSIDAYGTMMPLMKFTSVVPSRLRST
jgi:hypothetical protein